MSCSIHVAGLRARLTMRHEDKVARIAQQLRERSRDGGHASLQKSAISHFVPNPKDPKHDDRKVDIRGLDQILEIDAVNKRCVCEPGVTFRDLLRSTLPLGLAPKLVPELETITLGGAIAGCSVESMSFRHGGLHDSCLSYEVVTGTGEVISCSPTRDPDLFEMVHGSYGTLGILTKIELELIPAAPYVHMDYRHLSSFEEFHEQLIRHCREGDVDFIDGIVHAPDHFVLCLGSFVQSAPWTSDYTHLKVYYKSTAERRDDYLTTEQYYFRYDTECHWLTRSLPVPGMESIPMRLLLGKVLLGSSNILTWGKRLRPLLKYQRSPDVVVDVFIPEPRLPEFWTWYRDVLSHYPLWVVPYRAPKPYAWIHPDHAQKEGELYIDCAIYGKRNDEPGKDYHKLLEDRTYELGGLKTLISRNQYDRSTFWKIYNRELYDRVKARTDPKNLFRNLYDKFHPQAG